MVGICMTMVNIQHEPSLPLKLTKIMLKNVAGLNGSGEPSSEVGLDIPRVVWSQI